MVPAKTSQLCQEAAAIRQDMLEFGPVQTAAETAVAVVAAAAATAVVQVWAVEGVVEPHFGNHAVVQVAWEAAARVVLRQGEGVLEVAACSPAAAAAVVAAGAAAVAFVAFVVAVVAVAVVALRGSPQKPSALGEAFQAREVAWSEVHRWALEAALEAGILGVS